MKTYNVNAMRPALKEAYENGNTKAISVKDCQALGITVGYFEIYKNNLENLFNALCEYSRIKHTPDAKAEDIANAYEQIFPLWKEAMSNAEKKKDSKDFSVDLRDVEDLLGFVQKFQNNSNEKNAVKVWSMETFTLFRRKVETMLGIKIAKAEVMTDAMRDYLRKEKALINKINNCNSAIDKAKADNDVLNGYLAKVTEKSAKDIFNTQIKSNKAKISKNKETVKELQAKLDTLRSEIPEK